MRVTQKHLVYSLLGVIAVASAFILFIGYMAGRRSMPRRSRGFSR